jgi:hypothetical protein
LRLVRETLRPLKNFVFVKPASPSADFSEEKLSLRNLSGQQKGKKIIKRRNYTVSEKRNAKPNEKWRVAQKERRMRL